MKLVFQGKSIPTKNYVYHAHKMHSHCIELKSFEDFTKVKCENPSCQSVFVLREYRHIYTLQWKANVFIVSTVLNISWLFLLYYIFEIYGAVASSSDGGDDSDSSNIFVISFSCRDRDSHEKSKWVKMNRRTNRDEKRK